MFHPQLGMLNYLLSLVGLPPSALGVSPSDGDPDLVLVEIWQWTPLVMLIVLGGLAAHADRALRERRRSTAPPAGRCSATSRCR